MNLTTHRILRFALAFAFLYPPVSAFMNPYAWIGYFPAFVTSLPINGAVLLHTFGVLEVALSIWILSGKYIRISASCAALILAPIVLFNLSQFDVLFRDVSILMIAVALVYEGKQSV